MRTERNAVILAAGTSSRFVPLSAERPKGLLEVNGEVLIERQIRQLQEAGVRDITIVTGYKAEMFSYLEDKFGVRLVYNEDYARYNNTSSIIRVLDLLGDTYICSSDNYFPKNVFMEEPTRSYYSALYSDGETGEYCLRLSPNGLITGVEVGGRDSWYMVGHVFFSRGFSEAFRRVMAEEYAREETRKEYWEDVYIRHIGTLPPMEVRRYDPEEIEEFDTLDELRRFDTSYIRDTRSAVLKEVAARLGCGEEDLSDFKRIPGGKETLSFTFKKEGEGYACFWEEGRIDRI